MTRPLPPAGYTHLEESGAIVVARLDIAQAVASALRSAPSDQRSLHGFASRDPNGRAFRGRDVAYAVRLPSSSMRVVVRHNRHGGFFRSVTGDLFLQPTRAPAELDLSLALSRLGIPTPNVLAYAIYPAMAGFARSDVVTEELSDSEDLGAVLRQSEPTSAARDDAWRATGALLDQLAAAGIRHHDLNVKNVLLRSEGDASRAFLLDVDRVKVGLPRSAAATGNAARLVRSVEKWRRLHGARVTDAELAALRRTATSTR